jgi:carboxylesterase
MSSSISPKRTCKMSRFLCAGFLALVCGLFFYSGCAHRHLRKEIAAADRDPLTGVIRGAEAVTLAPQGADPRTSGTAVLMIHGFLAARSDFADLGERLARRGFTVRLMRLPGHGTIPPDLEFLPDGALFQAVHQEYLKLRAGHRRVCVVGFSMGGALATLLASMEPVDRLVLAAPYYGVSYKWYYVLPPETWNTLIGWAVPYLKKSERFTRINDRSQVRKFFRYQTVPTGGVRQLVALGKAARRPETLRKVTCPVLLLHAEGDEAASAKAARKAFEQLGSPRKEAVWFQKSNHIIFWDYDRDEVKRRVEEFLLSH